MKIKEKAKELNQNISAIYIAMKKKKTPFYAKMIAGITIGYALSPIDIVPDFIPILGYIDDIILLPFLAYLSVKLIPKKIMDEAKVEAREIWKEGRPKKWYYAIPIVLIWIGLFYILMKQIIK